MYKFVKIKRKGSDNGTWFFNPQTEDQVIEHFQSIFGREIKDGVNDRFKGGHPMTPWGRTIEPLMTLYGCSWLEAAIRLENEVINNRLNDFRKGDNIFFNDGVLQTYLIDGDEVIDEIEKETLDFPIESQHTLDEVRYMQWNMPDMQMKGNHWYAKVGVYDIKDKDGNLKWNTKAEAEEAAKWFIENLNIKEA